MLKPSLQLAKSAYTLEAIRSAILSFQSACCTITDAGDFWQIDSSSIGDDSIQGSEVLRRIDEYALRESLEKRFGKERDAIMAIAFGQE